MYGNRGGGTRIKMAVNLVNYTEPSLTGGIDQTLVEVITAVPSFFIGLLLFVFGFVFLTGTNAQKKRTGYSDYPMWAVMASLSTLMITLLGTIKAGMVNLETFSIVIAITIFSGLWLFLSKGRGEL